MITYDGMIRTLQRKLAHRAWEICKEDAYKNFYKSKGRALEARASKKVLRELHKDQVQDKAMLKVIQSLHGYEQAFEANPALFFAQD